LWICHRWQPTWGGKTRSQPLGNRLFKVNVSAWRHIPRWTSSM
jgi:hypothetical protein